MIAISLFLKWYETLYNEWQRNWLFSLSSLSFIWIAPDRSMSIIALAIVDSQIITEHHFHPIVHTPWLFFLAHFNLLFLHFTSGLHLVFLCKFNFIQLISNSLVRNIYSPVSSHLFIEHFLFLRDILTFLSWYFDIFWGSTRMFSSLTTLFLLYLYLILNTANLEQSTYFITLHNKLPSWMNFSIQFIELTVLLLEPGWVLWHINHCRLFNAKSSLYIYIKYIWFGLVGFYGISTIVGYLMTNPLYTYILKI